MSEFTDELKKLDLAINLPSKTYFAIEEKFNDWQPPKKLVEVPQFVADWFEDKMVVSFLSVVSAYSFSDYEDIKWIQDNGGIDLLCKMKLYGYTVEKEKLYRLKNKITNQYINMNPYNGHCHESIIFGDRYKCVFTQSEIDDMETGSYEQIKVESHERPRN